MHLIWAYKANEDGDDPQNFPFHSAKGSTTGKHVIVPSLPTVSTTTPPGLEKTTVSSQGGRLGVRALSGVLLAVTLSFLWMNL